MALETMDLHEVRSAMEGILFAAGEPVNIDRICLALELDKPTAEQVLQELGDYYAFERRGIRLVRMENCYQLCSAPDYADIIRKAFEIRKPRAPMSIRCAVWTARTRWDFCRSVSSSRSADGSRCRDGPGSTARRRNSCACSI